MKTIITLFFSSYGFKWADPVAVSIFQKEYDSMEKCEKAKNIILKQVYKTGTKFDENKSSLECVK